jgi:hypothetical protein
MATTASTIEFLNSREMPRMVDLPKFSHILHAFPALARHGFVIKVALPEQYNVDGETENRSVPIVFTASRPQPTLARKRTKYLLPSPPPQEIQSTALK